MYYLLETEKEKKKNYDRLKEYDGKVYTGMRIGGTHNWQYPNGRWLETKVAPDKWEFTFDSLKVRNRLAGENTGAAKGTTYHWYILADQLATKLDNNSYETSMKGVKFKLGHKRPYWRMFSYDYEDQLSYKEMVIQVLEETLRALSEED
ncbi:hypothetical protein [[Eubacterium] cellulosolvens]